MFNAKTVLCCAPRFFIPGSLGVAILPMVPVYHESLWAYDFFSSFTGFALVGFGILLISWLPILANSRGFVGPYRVESYGLIVILLFSCVSLICSTSLLTTLLSLEALSFCAYVLTVAKLTLRSAIGGWLYAISGGLVSIFMIAGIALLVGQAGSSSYAVLGYFLSYLVDVERWPVSVLVGLVLVFVGFLFKLSVAPYHSWAPDVYAAAPFGVTALFATVVKFSVFVAFLRLVVFCFFPAFDLLCRPVLIAFGGLSLLVGSLGGIDQAQIKRLLAYSAISHMGFVLVGLAQLPISGMYPPVCYMVVYALTTLGVFSLLSDFSRDVGKARGVIYITELVLLRKYPLRAFFLVVLLFSLLGLPPFAGFFVKYNIFVAVLASGSKEVGGLLVLGACVSAFYYLRLIHLVVFGGERKDTKVFPFDCFAVRLRKMRLPNRVIPVGRRLILTRLFLGSALYIIVAVVFKRLYEIRSEYLLVPTGFFLPLDDIFLVLGQMVCFVSYTILVSSRFIPAIKGKDSGRLVLWYAQLASSCSFLVTWFIVFFSFIGGVFLI